MNHTVNNMMELVDDDHNNNILKIDSNVLNPSIWTSLVGFCLKPFENAHLAIIVMFFLPFFFVLADILFLRQKKNYSIDVRAAARHKKKSCCWELKKNFGHYSCFQHSASSCCWFSFDSRRRPAAKRVDCAMAKNPRAQQFAKWRRTMMDFHSTSTAQSKSNCVKIVDNEADHTTRPHRHLFSSATRAILNCQRISGINYLLLCARLQVCDCGCVGQSRHGVFDLALQSLETKLNQSWQSVSQILSDEISNRKMDFN